jgi:hypothetical protein
MLRCVPKTLVVVLLASALVVSGCATEVIESKVTTTVFDATPTTTESLAGAELAELADVLQTEMTALAEAVFNNNSVAARAQLARINEAWSYAEPLIVASYGELADQITYDLRRVVELARSAVERNRPADASKAVTFLRLALESLQL